MASGPMETTGCGTQRLCDSRPARLRVAGQLEKICQQLERFGRHRVEVLAQGVFEVGDAALVGTDVNRAHPEDCLRDL